MPIYRTPGPESIRAKLCNVLKRDLGIEVSDPHKTYTRGWPRCNGAPLWLAYGAEDTFGSRYTMTECVRRGVVLANETEGGFVRLVIPRMPNSDKSS